MDNPQKDLALKIIESTDTHLFLTGRAGTGKTTFLRQLRKELPKRMVVLAPTGIAAINAEGVTIHSFFQLSFAPHVPGMNYAEKRSFAMSKQKIKLIQSIDLLVIDEISMVRADLLDAVDEALRKFRHDQRPFGGVQLLLIGDLQQLSPVIKDEEWEMLRSYYDTPYFFSSIALKKTHYVTVELEKVYRQGDSHFLSLLNDVREGNASASVLEQLNKQYKPQFVPSKADGYIRLVTHNYQAHEINAHELEVLNTTPFTFNAQVKGKFPEMSYPTDAQLVIKQGAQVMFVKNDTDKQYFNGMIGEVVEVNDKGFKVRPNNDPLKLIDVQPEAWQNARYGLDENTKEIKEIVEGTFTQYPVKLAWAITIHKSQGLTFEHVMIDASRSFAHGQTYVALSRCKTLEGIVLTSPIPPTAIIADKNIDAFNDEMRNHEVTVDQLNVLRQAYSVNLLTYLFSFEKERIALAAYTRLMQMKLSGFYAETIRTFEQGLKAFDLSVVNVAGRFHGQYQQILANNGGSIEDALLQERIKKGAVYFDDQLQKLYELVTSVVLDIDNAELRKQLNKSRTEVLELVLMHSKLLAYVVDEGFSVSQFLHQRAKSLLEMDDKKTGAATSRSRKSHAEEPKYTVPAEVKNAELYYRLKKWRVERAEELHLSAYVVLNTKAMMSIANYVPDDVKKLSKIPYFGKTSMQKFGDEILDIIGVYLDDKKAGRIKSETVVNSVSREGESTYDTTLRLFKDEHRSASEIAEMRDLNVGTIMSHLERWVDAGKIAFEQVVDAEHYRRIKTYYEQHPEAKKQPLSEVRREIGDDIYYAEINLTLNKLKK